MKRVYFRNLFFFLLFLPSLSFAQNGYNNLDFENWTTDGFGLGWDVPEGFAVTYEGVENTTDPQNGGSALRVNTKEETLVFQDTVGIAANAPALDQAIGDPYTQRPDSMSGYIRYEIPTGDTGVVFAQLTQYDQASSSRQVVGSAVGILPPDTLTNWTQVSFDFDYQNCLTPDTLTLFFGSEAKTFFGIGNTTIGANLEADNFQLHVSQPQIDSLQTEDAVCGNNGSIEVHASNVDSCTQYSIDAGGSYQTDSVFTSLSPGSYEVIALNANGSDTVNTSIVGPSPLGVDSVDTVSASCGTPDGEFTVHASGGNGDHEFRMDGGAYQTDSTFSNLLAGTYDFTVRDDSGCTYMDSVKIGTTVSGLIDSVSIGDDTCSNGNGSILIHASGGMSPYQYNLDGGTNQADSNFTGLSSGTYTAEVMDANGCVDDTTVSVPDLPGPTLDSVDITDATCGMSDGEIQIHASGGSGSLDYKAGSVGYQTSDQVTGLSAGDHDAIVRDANMCADTMMNVTVDTALVPELSSINADKDTVDLNNSGDVNFSSNGSGNSFTWDFDDGNTDSGQNVTHTYDSTGTFEATVYAEVGNCVDSASVVVEVINSTSIEEPSEGLSEVNISPNPTNGRFRVELDQSRSGTIEVRDLTGRVVYSEALEASDIATVDLSDREEGVYIVRILGTESSEVKVGRIVLSR